MRKVIVLAAAVAVVFLVTGFSAGQSIDPGAPAPRSAPRGSAKAWNPPRTPDGQPDIQGTWGTGPDEVLYTGDVETGEGDETARRMQGRVAPKGKGLVIDPPDGFIPYQPWAAAKREQIPHGRAGEQIGRKISKEAPSKLRHLRPQTLCVVGTPRMNFDRDFKIVQTPGQVLMLWEFTHAFRVIPLDGHPHIAPNIKLSMGDSRGRWEGNTLVIETTNLNDWDWFDASGTFRSNAVSLVERYTFADRDTLTYQVTITDPNVFTRPWTVAFAINRRNDGEIFESACHEGNYGVTGILGHDPRNFPSTKSHAQ
jgi:hypothetical protein